MLEMFLQQEVKLEIKNQHAVITSAYTSNVIKISTFLFKSEIMFYLSSAPLSILSCPVSSRQDNTHRQNLVTGPLSRSGVSNVWRQ